MREFSSPQFLETHPQVAPASGADSVASDFAIAYKPNQRYAFGETGENSLTYQASLEGSVHTGDTKPTNSLKLHPADLTSDISLSNAEEPAMGLHLRGGPSYEASQDFRRQDTFAQIYGTATYAPICVGVYSHEFSSAALQMRWRPDFEFDVGAHMERDAIQSTMEPHSAIVRAIPGALASVRSITLARQAGIQEVNFTIGDRIFFLPMEERSYNHVQTSLNFILVPGFTLSAQYRDGRAAPTYNQDNYVGVRLAVQIDPRKSVDTSR